MAVNSIFFNLFKKSTLRMIYHTVGINGLGCFISHYSFSSILNMASLLNDS